MIDIDALKRDKRPQSAWVVHALIDRLEAAEKELAELRSSMKFRTSLIGRTEAERDALRAKMAEMEQQEPVGKFIQHPSNGIWEQDGYGDNPDARPLYALPGAHPAPSVPDDIVREVLRDCCGTFHGSRHRITCEKYKGKRDQETSCEDE